MTFLIAQPVRNDSPVQAAPKAQTPAPTNPAVHGGYDTTGRFKFHSEQDRINWLRKGYRQGMNPEAFAQGTPLHPDEEAAYASGALEPPHHVFQGPDGIHRGKNAATRELPEIHEARMRAWDGVRFKDVDPHAEKHIGEDEALKVMMKGAVSPTSDVSHPTENQPAVRRLGKFPFIDGAPYSGIIKVASSDGKDGGVAGAVVAAGAAPKPNIPLKTNTPLPRRPQSGQAVQPRWQPPIPGSAVPPAARSIRSTPPFERVPTEMPVDSAKTGRLSSAEGGPKLDLPSQMPGDHSAGYQDWEEAAKWKGWPLNTLPHANHERTPESIVAGVLDNETQRAYEAEWARLTKQKPDAVAQDKEDFARRVGAEAASEYQATKHEQVAEDEFDSFIEAARRKLNLPVTNWRGQKEDAARSVDLENAIRNGEVDVYDHALDVMDVADMLANGQVTIAGTGRPGNEQTQKHVAILAKKIADELTRCGAKVQTVYGKDERQVQPGRGGNLGSHWPDISAYFEVDGKKFILDVNHAATYAKTGQLKPGEAKQIEGLYWNRWAQLQKEGSKERGGSIYAFPKKHRQMTEEEYFAKMDEFVKAIIDCKSPVKIKVVLQKRKYGDEPPLPANER